MELTKNITNQNTETTISHTNPCAGIQNSSPIHTHVSAYILTRTHIHTHAHWQERAYTHVFRHSHVHIETHAQTRMRMQGSMLRK